MRLGLVQAPQVEERSPELAVRHGDVRVLFAEDLPPHRERLFERGAGGVELRLLEASDAEVVQALGQLAARPQGPAPEGDGLVEQRHGQLVGPAPLVDPAQEGEHLALQVGLGGEVLPRPGRAGVEQAPHRGLALTGLVRVGLAQQVGQEAAHLGRPVAFLGEPGAVEGHDRGQGEDRRGGRPEDPRVAAHELPGPVGHGIGTGEDRLLGEVAAQVLGQGGDRGVALLGAFLQGLGDDGVEVAPQLAPQARVAGRVGQAGGLGLQDRPVQGGRRGPGLAGRVAAREEEIEQGAQGVDVGGRGHALARDLLGRGERRGEGAPRFQRQLGRRAVPGVPLEELGDAEVEELHPAVLRHHDVRRLEVAVDDEVRVGVRHGGEDVEEEPDAGLDVEGPALAPAVDRLALDVLEHEVRLAGRGDAGVEELGDVGVFQPRQDRGLAAEAGGPRRAQERGGEELDRGHPLEVAVDSPRQPDAAHPAGAERLDQRIGAEDLSHEAGLGEQVLRVVLQVLLVAQGALFSEEQLEVRGERGVCAREVGEIPLPLLDGELERLVEVGADEPPALALHSRISVRSAWRR